MDSGGDDAKLIPLQQSIWNHCRLVVGVIYPNFLPALVVDVPDLIVQTRIEDEDAICFLDAI